MTDEISKVTIEKSAEVDVKRPEATPLPVVSEAKELSMSEYATRREAEMRGENFEEKKAAATEIEPTAATTDKTAVATEANEDGKTPTESATEEEPEKVEPKKGKDKRFDELTFQREEAKREAEQAKKEAVEAKAELARIKQEAEARAAAAIPVVPKVEDDPVPDRENFEDPDEFAGALAAHAARAEIRKANETAVAAEKTRQEAIQAEAETARKAQVQEQIATLHKNFNERVVTAKTEYPDFDEKVTNNEKLVVRNDIFFTIEKAELAPHILYHLAGNPEEVTSLNAMSPYEAAIRIGELQAEVRTARKPKPSKAAEPVKPVGNRQSPARKTGDEMSMEEYAAMRAEEEEQARARRKPRVRQS